MLVSCVKSEMVVQSRNFPLSTTYCVKQARCQRRKGSHPSLASCCQPVPA